MFVNARNSCQIFVMNIMEISKVGLKKLIYIDLLDIHQNFIKTFFIVLKPQPFVHMMHFEKLVLSSCEVSKSEAMSKNI